MTKEEIRMFVPEDEAPTKWTGRRRLETPERPAMLGKMVPIYDHNTSKHPDRIRVSFDDGSTVVYDLRRDQPHPITVKCVETIQKWNGYNNQPMRRRRKP